MYEKAYGVIKTLAPVHVGASAGEETGNLNLIFRDQFTQTGIIPGSSIRGRFRADMRDRDEPDRSRVNKWYGHAADDDSDDPLTEDQENKKDRTTEALVKFEYANLVWLPVFCPGQPVVWVSCPRLLSRYRLVSGMAKDQKVPAPYTAPAGLQARPVGDKKRVLFFNLGFMELEHQADLSQWIPKGAELPENSLVVVADNDIAMLHDMALYRQSRVALAEDQKKVKGGAFFNVEALPEGSVLAFPIALKQQGWDPFGGDLEAELYFGGLESIGFGRCQVTLVGDSVLGV